MLYLLDTNTLRDNPRSAAIHHGLQLGEWGIHPWVAGQIAIVGNVMNHGPDTRPGLPLFSTNGTPSEVFLDDNLAFDRAGNPVRLASGVYIAKDSPPTWPPGLRSVRRRAANGLNREFPQGRLRAHFRHGKQVSRATPSRATPVTAAGSKYDSSIPQAPSAPK